MLRLVGDCIVLVMLIIVTVKAPTMFVVGAFAYMPVLVAAIAILLIVDIARTLRSRGPKWSYGIGVVGAIPQVVIGVACAMLGAATFASSWINGSWGQPEGWGMYTICPALVLFGVWWTRRALRRLRKPVST
jgi:hypothetical protein